VSKKPVPSVRQAVKRERQVTVEFTVDQDERLPKRWCVTVTDYVDTTGGLSKPTDVAAVVYALDGNGRAILPSGKTTVIESLSIQDWTALREGVDRAIEEFRKAYQGDDRG
jgi:hypothetical protein